MEKREFVKKLSAASLLATLGIPLDSCNPNSIPEPDPQPANNDPLVIDITTGTYSDLQNDQGWVLDDSNNLLLLNLGGEIIALTSVCTHAGCTTDWNYLSSDRQFICMCHNSRFSSDGNVVNGPASSPLRRFTANQDGNTLTVFR